MFTKTERYGRFLVVLMFLAALAGCGGGGGSSSDSGADGGTGSVGLLLTDGPTDDFDAVNITIVKAELLSDSGHVTIFFEEKGETVNLLDYRNDARILSLNSSVPVGTYEKIRLTLSDIELVKCGAAIQPIDVNSCTNTIADHDQPRLTGNKKLDLNPRGDFVVHSGSVLMVEIDIDANKSIHIVETGNGKYQFRPVVFVNIITSDNPGKPVRIHGTIEEVDQVDRDFEICSREINLLPSIDVIGNEIACVNVTYNDATLIFIEDVSVDPDALQVGDEVTVFGNLHLDDGGDEVVHHAVEVDDHHHFDGIFIEAVVIDIEPDGTGLALDGVALAAVDTRSLFDMSVDPGQGFPNSEVTVLILPGARIVERDGSIIPVSFIQPGVPLSIYGNFDPDDNLLFARLIVIDTEAGAREKLSGIIGLISDKVCGFNLVTKSSGDRSVSADNKSTLVLRFANKDLDIILVDDLRSGNTVHMFGQPDVLDPGCFAAEIIVVLEELGPDPK
jgi:hypothetical protein